MSHGLVMLNERFFTLNKFDFSCMPPGPAEVEGHDVSDVIKQRINNLPLFRANLMVTLTKNLKLCYLNLDSMFVVNEAVDKQPFHVPQVI